MGSSTMLSNKVIISFFLCAAPLCFAEYRLECPSDAKYQLFAQPASAGWDSGFRANATSGAPPKALVRTAKFEGAVLYFEGSIEDRVELQGELGVKYKGRISDIVTLDKDKKYVAECLYSEGVVLWKQLPPNLNRCINSQTNDHKLEVICN